LLAVLDSAPAGVSNSLRPTRCSISVRTRSITANATSAPSCVGSTWTPPEEAAKKVAAAAPDAWQQICQLYLKQWVTPGQRAKLEAEYNAGIATGKSWREIGTALGQIVKGWKRGR
jgi:hypothetical protein